MKKLLVTGAAGLIGSEVSSYFAKRGWSIFGIDNNQRAAFFGPDGDTVGVLAMLKSYFKNFTHYDIDIRSRAEILKLVKDISPDAIVHAAAQPSHDLAAKIPFDDFDINAAGTLNLLEAARLFSPETIFIFLSTNKVYGDGPNRIPLTELEKRWDYADPRYKDGIPETFPVDQAKHSLFGASKLAADIMVQEYGRYFGLRSCCLRGGCLTGPNHAGAEMHGFLNYLVKCNMEKRVYRIFGYKGKQVRDNIHSYDVVAFIGEFIKAPKAGEVYNIGGGKDNTCSILEAFDIISLITGIKMRYEYVDENREGDHICYYSDLSKVKAHYPNWSIGKPLKAIFEEMAAPYAERVCK